MTTLDELTVTITADTAELKRRLREAGVEVEQSGRRMSSALSLVGREMKTLIPLFSAAAVVSFAGRSVEAAGRISDLAEQIGFAASTLSALETPLVQSGSSLEQFATSISFMRNQIGEAARDIDGPAAESFRNLGLDVQALMNMKPEQAFFAIGNAISRLGNEFAVTEQSRNNFGRGVAGLIPTIQKANGDLEGTVKKAGEISNALSGEALTTIDTFGDNLEGAAIKARNAFLEAAAAVIDFMGLVNDVPLAKRPAPSPVGPAAQQVAERQRRVDALRAGIESGKLTGGMAESSLRIEEQKLKDAKAALEQLQAKTKLQPAGQSGKATEELDKLLAPTKKADEATKKLATSTKSASQAVEDFNESQKEQQHALDETAEQAIITATIIEDHFGDALESVMFDFESLGDSVSRIMDGIARDIARQHIISPLTSGIGGFFGDLIGSSGGFSQILDNAGAFLGLNSSYGPMPSFAVGTDRVPHDMIARIHKDEMIIPAAEARSMRAGSGGITVVNHFNLSGMGAAETARRELQQVMPALIDASVNATRSAIEQGGSYSAQVGRRG